jgi:type IV pilus assembly protein PilA
LDNKKKKKLNGGEIERGTKRLEEGQAKTIQSARSKMKMRKNMRNNKEKAQQGFSLIELLIVVSIILIIAAIAIPSLLRAKTVANEASAVGSLRTLNTACITYSSTFGLGYPAALSNLAPSAVADQNAADLIDGVLASGVKSGYTFTYTAAAAAGGVVSTYTVNADPTVRDQTGTRSFFTDQSGVIRQNVGGPADVNGTPVS